MAQKYLQMALNIQEKKWIAHGSKKKKINSNPNSYSSPYSYLQAIFSLLSLRSAGPTLVYWHGEAKKPWQACFDL